MKKSPKVEVVEQPHTVREVRIDKVQSAVLIQYAKAVGLDINTDTNSIVDSLAKLLQELPDGNRVRCTACGGVSDKRMIQCPYCGDKDEPGDDTVDSTRETEADAIAELRTKVSVNPPAVRVIPKPPPSPVPVQPAVVEAIAQSAKAESVQIVEASPIVAVSQEVVAAYIAESKQDHKGALTGIYKMGQKLLRMYKEKWYLVFRTRAGKVKYPTWTAFIDSEYEGYCTYRYSFILMKVCANYSLDQVIAYGPKKLNALLGVPDDALRTELEGKLNDGMSLEKLREEIVKKVKGDDPVSPSERGPTSVQNEVDVSGIENDGLDSMPEPRTPPPAPAKPKKPPIVTTTFYAGREVVAPALVVQKDKATDRRETSKLKHTFEVRFSTPNGAILRVRLRNGKLGVEGVLVVEQPEE